MLSKEKCLKELREFIPNAKMEDWDLIIAGQRVQVIINTEAGGKGTVEFFGTEMIASANGSIAALLGASTAVHAILEILEKCFTEQIEEWDHK